jgi:hypothetical protein
VTTLLMDPVLDKNNQLLYFEFKMHTRKMCDSNTCRYHYSYFQSFCVSFVEKFKFCTIKDRTSSEPVQVCPMPNARCKIKLPGLLTHLFLNYQEVHVYSLSIRCCQPDQPSISAPQFAIMVESCQLIRRYPDRCTMLNCLQVSRIKKKY